MIKKYENSTVEMPFINPYANLPKITAIQGKLGAYVKTNLTKKQKNARNKANKAKKARKINM